MLRLTNRQKQIPGGYRFYIAQIPKWKCRPGSFDNICQQVLSVLVANPQVCAKNGWQATPEYVANLVEQFNARLCQANGWTEYYTNAADGGQPVNIPFPVHNPAPHLVPSVTNAVAGVKRLAAGAALLFEWEESGRPPVASELAEARAAVCVKCERNDPAHVSKYFTVPVSKALQNKLSRLHQMDLKTSLDAKLGICDACLCPLRLKTWTPIDLIEKHMSDDTRALLWDQCWIKTETVQKQ